MQEELQAFEALAEQRRSLQLLVSELLLENQNLRMTMAKLKSPGETSAAMPLDRRKNADNQWSVSVGRDDA